MLGKGAVFMSAIGVSIMAVFAVYGAFELLHAVAARLLRTCTQTGADVVIYVRAGGDGLEGTVRALAAKNPGAEIVIADDIKDEHTRAVASRLQRFVPRTHLGHIERR